MPLPLPLAVARRAERSEGFCPDRGGTGEQAVLVHPGDEEAGGLHGPTVWELDGPVPALNRSKTLIAATGSSRRALFMVQRVA
ncbi:hypothetical protein ABT224_16700 [Streptomyces sp. NPDC001584]|uniref:hypothetical protein n=1 Tax=Streptomyces sp. NPDC001584 TaxID=3154521 RepID=UPI00331AA84A